MKKVLRHSSRALLINDNNEILLFRFIFPDGNTNKMIWVTPGGGLKNNETFEVALKREVLEETGININEDLNQEFEKYIEISLKDEIILSHEVYFIIKIKDEDIDFSLMTDNEKKTFIQFKWWSLDDLKESKEEVSPNDLVDRLEELFL